MKVSKQTDGPRCAARTTNGFKSSGNSDRPASLLLAVCAVLAPAWAPVGCRADRRTLHVARRCNQNCTPGAHADSQEPGPGPAARLALHAEAQEGGMVTSAKPVARKVTANCTQDSVTCRCSALNRGLADSANGRRPRE